MLDWMTTNRNGLSRFLTGCSLLICCLAVWFGVDWRAEVLRKESRLQVYRDMISSTNYAFIVLDPQGRIVEWGPGAEQLFGYSSTDVLGQSPSFLMPTEFARQHNTAMQRTDYDFSRSLVDVNCHAYHKDGTSIPIHIVAASFRNHVGFYHAALIARREDVRKVDVPAPPAAQRPCPLDADGMRSVLRQKPTS